MKISYLDGSRLRRALMAAGVRLSSERAALNRINVFPVADGDTGTNLALTLRSVTDRLRTTSARSISDVANQAAEAAVLGARGNSGMLFSQFFLGFAEALDGRDRASGDALAAALYRGAERVAGALDEAVEGTIVTVTRDVALAGVQGAGQDVATLLTTLVEEARASLARTPNLLPVLKEAGVVDAGARGFVLILEATRQYLTGGDPRSVDVSATESPEGQAEAPEAATVRSREKERYRFCTEVLVRGEALPGEAAVRSLLRSRGDSLIVSRTTEALKVHIHTDEPEKVFESLAALGRVVTRKAEDMRVQAELMVRAHAGDQHTVRRAVGIVTDSACDLPDEVLRAHGISFTPLEVISGDGSRRDREEITAEQFHDELASRDVKFSTSQPSPGAFLKTWRAAAEEAEALVVVTLGSALSGTFRSAEAAARMFDGPPVHVFDSRGISVLQGLLVLRAAELAEAGLPAEEIVRTLEQVRNRSGILLTLDTLDRLRASGRIGAGAAWVGGRVGLKPILRVDLEGKVVRAGQVLGQARILPAVLRILEREVGAAQGGEGPLRFGLAHVACPDRADEVAAAIRGRWGVEVELPAIPATPAIANHVGAGAWAVSWMRTIG
jgi:uncharacterized protein